MMAHTIHAGYVYYENVCRKTSRTAKPVVGDGGFASVVQTNHQQGHIFVGSDTLDCILVRARVTHDESVYRVKKVCWFVMEDPK